MTKSTLQQVTDLFDLGNPLVRIVLHKLEDVQVDLGLARQSGDLLLTAMLEGQEAVLKEVIWEMHETMFVKE